MQESKLIFLLKTFKTPEWRRFGEFLTSPYFNKRKELVPFLDYLKSTRPDFPEKKLQKSIVYKKLYPNKVYDEKEISYLMNYLLKQAESFLGYEEFQKETSLLSNYTLKALNEKHLNKHFNHYSRKIEIALDTQEKNDLHQYYYKYQVANIKNQHFVNLKLRQYDINLQKTADQLDNFYFLQKLMFTCEMLNRHKFFAASYTTSFTQEIAIYLENKKQELEPLISIYFGIYQTLIKENAEENFQHLIESVNLYKSQIHDSEKEYIYHYLINYCLRQISKRINEQYYIRQCLKLYLEGINQDFLLNNGYLSPWTFKNVVKLSFNLKKYEDAELFIQKYHRKLEREFQADALNYNLADLYYRRKDYHKAQSHLIQVEYSDIFYNLDAKLMLLKIYYETGEEEPLLSLLASFTIYLKRNNKIANSKKEIYLNFTALLSLILRTKQEKIIEVKEKISNTKILTAKAWLLQICEDLKK